MIKKQLIISYEVFQHISELSMDDATLLLAARQATVNAYAPYSRFHVAAAARMVNGNIITGTNQENASFPAGICAERVLLSAVSAVYPGEKIQDIAISYNGDLGNSKRPLAPCGLCRQSLAEAETRFNQPIRLILGGMEGEIFVFSSVKELLPLDFSGEDLKDNSRA
jgi:cytidine deaminase